jgi:superfamily II DNA or RNA helicase
VNTLNLLVTVDNRIRLPSETPTELVKRLKEVTTHPNPEYGKARALGRWVGSVPTEIKTWRMDVRSTAAGKQFSFPRGVAGLVRSHAASLGIVIRWSDKRTSVPVDWKPFLVEPRPYQSEGIAACVEREQGIVKAPTGSGKTSMALGALPQLKQRALVIVRDRNLLEQWLERAESELGLKKREVGVVSGGKRRIGERLTLSLQQTLYSKSFPLEEFAQQFGAVLVDEVHEAAARTVSETVDAFPARVRLGFSADHRRRDRKEFLSEDLFGDVIFEVSKQQLEAEKHVVPVVVRLVPTAFAADWYADAPTEERDFMKLISEMSADEERGLLLRRVVLELVSSGCAPVLVFTHRREHASRLAERELPADGVPTGLLLGSAGSAVQFEESKSLLLKGVLKVAVGTFKAVGQGIDLPNVMAGVCATPIGANKQFFGQVRGRVCRVWPGKQVGYLYYLWDEQVFPDAGRNLLNWNDGLVEIFDRANKQWMTFRGSP